MQKTFSIKTLGCKLNQYESSLIAGQFIENGWVGRPFGEKVDAVIINTCTVTNRSDKKCKNYIRQGAAFSNKGKVLVTGCMGERDADYLKNMPEVFTVVKNSEKEKIFSVVNSGTYLVSIGNEINEINGINEIQDNITILKKNEFPLPFYRTRGLVKIQDGCDGECSYCIVPYVRGKPVSRNFKEVLDHAYRLIDSGCPELILTGITIGKYLSNDKNLAKLIDELVNIDGKFRVRITSIEPNHISDDLIECFSFDKVCSHIHVPLQSGSDRILKLMKRRYSVNEYIKIIDRIRKKNNDISIGTDVIIGFPEESEDDFLLSMKTIEDIGFSYVHQFTFSKRSGTQASLMNGCSNKEISERSSRMRELANSLAFNYRKRFLGMYLPSIIEKNKSRDGYKAVSSNYIKMDIKNILSEDDKIGIITDVRLEALEIERAIGVL
ncbi:MAG: tRNA (N(6)-L-threonylcarbamoyladenosine(37)-C(2))-methylthiotransferase MtaB [Spirochaetota bacterium]